VRTAGAANGPGVRRAHGAVRQRGRRGWRRLGQGERRGAWTSGGTRLGRRGRREGAWGKHAEVRPAKRGARARDVAACWRPTLTVFLTRF
jgi:hypothetical protein